MATQLNPSAVIDSSITAVKLAAEITAGLFTSGEKASVFNGVEYDSNTKRINFKNGSTVKAYVDATNFIKDGMVDEVKIENRTIESVTVKCLVITFNTDAGKEDIVIPVSDIVNMDLKEDVANKSSGVITSSSNDTNYPTCLAVWKTISGFTGGQANVITGITVDGNAVTVTNKVAAISLTGTYVQKENGKGLSTNDFTDAYKNKLTGIAEGAEVNVITGITVDGNAVTVSSKVAAISLTGTYVQKETGKGLSTNDFTDAYKNKLTGIASGAEVNVIDTVKVNGTALTVTNKAVDVTVPTAVSSLTDSATYANKIETVKVNGTALTITSKAVDITVPTAVSSLTDSANYENKIEVIKVNGTSASISNKAVDISVPTETSITNSGFLKSHATHKITVTNDTAATASSSITFVESLAGSSTASSGNLALSATRKTITIPQKVADLSDSATYANKIESITVNGTAATISNKTVALTIPAEVTDSTVSGWGYLKTHASHKVDITNQTATNAGSSAITYVESLTGATAATTGNMSLSAVRKTITVPTKVSDLSDSATYANKIETVKVNGTALTISSKAVDVTVPTAVSSLTDSATYANKIETITVNGSTATITNKTVALTIPAEVTDSTVSGWGYLKSHASHKINITNQTATTATSSITFVESLTGATATTTGNMSLSAVRKTITVPTKVADLSDSATYANKIETITVNGTAATITNKTVALTIPAGLPSVSSSDNGKILMVSGGTWQLVTPVSIYTGGDAPNNSVGINGDIYLQTS